jgi:hypothetical protein
VNVAQFAHDAISRYVNIGSALVEACGPVLLQRRHIRVLSVGDQNGGERYRGTSGDNLAKVVELSHNARPTRYGLNRLRPQPRGHITAATWTPSRADAKPRGQSDIHVGASGFGRGFVPTGRTAKVTIRTERGALPRSTTSTSVHSWRLKRSAPRSDRMGGSSGMNTRGSRSSVVTVGPGRGRRWSNPSGSTTAWRAHSRGRPQAQRTHRSPAREPKGLS